MRWRAPLPRRAEAVLAGRRLRAGFEPESFPPEIVRLGQVHGDRVAVVDQPGFVPECDAAVTAAPGLVLSVRVADCVPVLVAGRLAIGIAHAGWRGTAAGIAGRMLAALHRLAGEDPRDLAAWIGPSIGPCCYTVGEEVARQFDPGLLRRDRDGLHLDLWRANRNQLLAAGIPAAGIHDGAICTRCHQHLLHSHRGSGGRPGRNEAFLVRPPDDSADHPERLRS